MKILTEEQCIQAIKDYLIGCDADELARLTGELFGGDCYADDDYQFEPNEFYSGQFDNTPNIG